MNWLGHHEFGEEQKPFIFSKSEENIDYDKESLDYWLKIWTNYYGYVLTISHPNTLLIHYDEYCKDPKRTIAMLIRKTGITTPLPDYQPFINRRKPDAGFSDDLYKEAQEIYRQLGNR